MGFVQNFCDWVGFEHKMLVTGRVWARNFGDWTGKSVKPNTQHIPAQVPSTPPRKVCEGAEVYIFWKVGNFCWPTFSATSAPEISIDFIGLL